MNGGVTVTGLVTGTHQIEDIGIAVPHKVAVWIPAEKALQSKDLWRGIQQGYLFKLDGAVSFRSDPDPPPAAPSPKLEELQRDNERLRRELEASEHRNFVLQQKMDGMQAQLGSMVTLLTRIEEKTYAASQQVIVAGPQAVLPPVSEVVGGDIPTFIPGNILPKNVEGGVSAHKETSEGSAVAGAASALKELRRKG